MDSFVSRIGGKKLLRHKIIDQFPEAYDRYIEVFGGAGWVLFAQQTIAKLEVYNDIDSDLVNLFRCVKYHCGEVQRELEGILNSREMFMDFLSQQGYTDIQRAARFYSVIRLSYGSDGRTFGCSSRNIERLSVALPIIQQRLQRTVIEHKSYESLIKVYDRPSALFFCDPPYHGTEKYYTNQFTAADHQRLHDILVSLKGKFVLTYNDDDFVRDLYRDFTQLAIERSNNLSKRKFKELIIKNY